MNLYLVVSETLYEKIPILDYGEGPLEPYKIVCLCAAETREQARWDAWKTDRTFDNDPRDMPNFRIRKVGTTATRERGIIEEEFDEETGAYLNEWGDIPDHAWRNT